VRVHNDIMEVPIYGISEAAQYLRVPFNTLRYWTRDEAAATPLIRLAGKDPARLSFHNLLECHVISSMRAVYDVRLPKVRQALKALAKYVQHKHPLIEQAFQTDRRDLFIEHLGSVVNLSRRDDQILIPGVMELYLERIERDPNGLFKLHPFVMERKQSEPRLIQLNPAVGFGKPVITGTAISTAVIASRFNARESVPDLASEYGVEPKQIEEAIRWEQKTATIAA
jgi:uncharacterized protein (DUF433 family)